MTSLPGIASSLPTTSHAGSILRTIRSWSRRLPHLRLKLYFQPPSTPLAGLDGLNQSTAKQLQLYCHRLEMRISRHLQAHLEGMEDQPVEEVEEEASSSPPWSLTPSPPQDQSPKSSTSQGEIPKLSPDGLRRFMAGEYLDLSRQPHNLKEGP